MAIIIYNKIYDLEVDFLYIKPSFVLRWGTYALLTGVGLWLFWRWLLPILAPFLAAFLLAGAMEGPVKYLCRRGWKREFASGICTLILLGAIIFGLGTLLSRGMRELSALSRTLPEMLNTLSLMLGNIRLRAGVYRSALPPELSTWLDSAVTALAESFSAIPARLSEKLIAFLSLAAAEMPGILLFTVTCGIGVYFISAAYPQMQAWLDINLPDVWQRRRLLLGSNVRFTLGRYLRAQGILMLITFFELFLGLMLLGIEGALLISAVVAFLDALPVLGAGLVLIPWAAVNLLSGDAAAGFGLIVLWGVITLVRSCIQAKLLGDQLGLHPLVTLLSIYAGWSIAGVWGMVLFPMLALMAKQLDIVPRIWRRSHAG